MLVGGLLALAAAGGCSAPDPSVSLGGHGIYGLDPPDAAGSSSSSGGTTLPLPVTAPSGGGSLVDGGRDSGLDDEATVALIANQRYLGPSFVKVSRVPYDSAAAPGAQVSEWVNASSAAAYERISPGVTGSDVVVPAGTMIVRAVLDADGGVGKLTVMFKGPLGYNPALGDWWFAVTNPDGVPAEADGGVMMGPLPQCNSCHVPRVNDSFLFGVPTDDRAGVVPADGGP